MMDMKPSMWREKERDSQHNQVLNQWGGQMLDVSRKKRETNLYMEEVQDEAKKISLTLTVNRNHLVPRHLQF